MENSAWILVLILLIAVAAVAIARCRSDGFASGSELRKLAKDRDAIEKDAWEDINLSQLGKAFNYEVGNPNQPFHDMYALATGHSTSSALRTDFQNAANQFETCRGACGADTDTCNDVCSNRVFCLMDRNNPPSSCPTAPQKEGFRTADNDYTQDQLVKMVADCRQDCYAAAPDGWNQRSCKLMCLDQLMCKARGANNCPTTASDGYHQDFVEGVIMCDEAIRQYMEYDGMSQADAANELAHVSSACPTRASADLYPRDLSN